MERFRDLTILPISADKQLVIACDSSAGIGEKPADVIATSTQIVAQMAIRVPLLELLCYGATPLSVVDTIGNEMVDTGQKAIQGIKTELVKAGLADVSINGSTEDNMVTQTTSIGVTVIGEKKLEQDFPTEISSVEVYQFGDPYVGDQVLTHIETLVSYKRISQVRQHSAVVDLLPVGSKGIRYEVSELARTNQLDISDETRLSGEIFGLSAGPATVVLALVQSTERASFEAMFSEAKHVVHLEKAGGNTDVVV